VGEATIALGLGLGGGKASTASGRPAGGGGFDPSTMSASFDGTNDYLAMGTSALSIDANFTISAWIRPDSASVSGYRLVGGWGNFTNGELRAMELLNGKLSLEIWAARISGSTTLSHSNWHHVAITLAHDASGGVGGSAVTIYVNGSSDGTGSYSRSAFSTSTTFVAGHATPTASGFNPFDGLIDEFAVFDSVLSSSQITSIYNSGVPGDLAPLSPVGWWRMGDGTGDTDSGGGAPANTDVIGTVVDQGSGGNNATGQNGPTFSTAVPPVFSTLSADLDGSDDYLTVTQNSAINISGDVTFSAWVKQDAQSTYGAIFTKRAVGGAMNYQFLMNTGTGAIGLGHSGGSWIYDTNALATGSWWHVVATVSSGTVQFYVNGVAKTSSSGVTITGTTHDLIIGATPGYNFFNGHIDEAAIFNSALSSSQVTAIYNSGQPADLTSYSPVGWWRMGDGTGDTDSGGGAPANTDVIGTVADQGSGGNNATGTNGPTYSSTTP
tara:strand:+ start:146 stop:1630 length:1485 start_codon:yes stop_codon:yes gene_type:complete